MSSRGPTAAAVYTTNMEFYQVLRGPKHSAAPSTAKDAPKSTPQDKDARNEESTKKQQQQHSLPTVQHTEPPQQPTTLPVLLAPHQQQQQGRTGMPPFAPPPAAASTHSTNGSNEERVGSPKGVGGGSSEANGGGPAMSVSTPRPPVVATLTMTAASASSASPRQIGSVEASSSIPWRNPQLGLSSRFHASWLPTKGAITKLYLPNSNSNTTTTTGNHSNNGSSPPPPAQKILCLTPGMVQSAINAANGSSEQQHGDGSADSTPRKTTNARQKAKFGASHHRHRSQDDAVRVYESPVRAAPPPPPGDENTTTRPTTTTTTTSSTKKSKSLTSPPRQPHNNRSPHHPVKPQEEQVVEEEEDPNSSTHPSSHKPSSPTENNNRNTPGILFVPKFVPTPIRAHHLPPPQHASSSCSPKKKTVFPNLDPKRHEGALDGANTKSPPSHTTSSSVTAQPQYLTATHPPHKVIEAEQQQLDRLTRQKATRGEEKKLRQELLYYDTKVKKMKESDAIPELEEEQKNVGDHRPLTSPTQVNSVAMVRSPKGGQAATTASRQPQGVAVQPPPPPAPRSAKDVGKSVETVKEDTAHLNTLFS